ncbi:MAG: hypothetical protein ACOC6E_02230, partial [Thermodesulfobacteriota bacterium]
GSILRCPYPHARIRKVNTSKAERLPGVRAVIHAGTPEADLHWSYSKEVKSKVAPVPWRSREAETVITGRRLDSRVAAKAAEAAVKDAHSLGKNGYKIPLLRGLLEEELQALGRI